MEKAEKLKLIVQLQLAKLDITKIRFVDHGYDWNMLGKDGQIQMEQARQDIDQLLNELKADQ